MVKTKKSILILFLASILLNIFDAIITMYGVSTGLVEEINPIMDYLLKIDPFLFFIIKGILLMILVNYIWLNQDRSHKAAMFLSLLIFFTLLLINISNIIAIINTGVIA